MAKEHNLSPVLLFLVSAVLLGAGWLMKSLPVFIFACLAPLFAISDHSKDDSRFWNLKELILAALAIGFFAARVFEMSFLLISLIQAIIMTLAFLGYSFAHSRLGDYVGKFTIVLFWIALEYLLVKLPWRDQFIFLGDALSLKPRWLTWTGYTGYFGTSLWILGSNLFLYLALLKHQKINWGFLIAALIWITGPIGFSYWEEGRNISRNEMISSRDHGDFSTHENYLRGDEVIPGTATGISVLILLVAVTRNKDRK